MGENLPSSGVAANFSTNGLAKIIKFISKQRRKITIKNLIITYHSFRMAMAAVVLEEWIQELAAIAHAHSLAEQQAAILG